MEGMADLRIRERAKQAVKNAIDGAIRAGRFTQDKIIDAARGIDVPTTRVLDSEKLPIEMRDEMAERITRGHATIASVSCGAAGAIPVAGLFVELAALAELNVVQVDAIARAYGFELGSMKPKGLARKLPLAGSRAVLLVPILAALNVRALERDGKMESIPTLLEGTVRRREVQAIGVRLSAAAAGALLKRLALKPLRRFVPVAGGAISAWSSYQFTSAVGEEAKKYFRELATGDVVVRGKKLPDS